MRARGGLTNKRDRPTAHPSLGNDRGHRRGADAPGAAQTAREASAATPRPCTRILDAETELARLGRQEPQLRLRLGERVDALARSAGHHELGFSSIEAYALERCGWGARWCQTTRGLARRLRERRLPSIRRALRSGQLTWSMAELLVAHASPEDEALLLEAASSRTFREMKGVARRPARSCGPCRGPPSGPLRGRG